MDILKDSKKLPYKRKKLNKILNEKYESRDIKKIGDIGYVIGKKGI